MTNTQGLSAFFTYVRITLRIQKPRWGTSRCPCLCRLHCFLPTCHDCRSSAFPHICRAKSYQAFRIHYKYIYFYPMTLPDCSPSLLSSVYPIPTHDTTRKPKIYLGAFSLFSHLVSNPTASPVVFTYKIYFCIQPFYC